MKKTIFKNETTNYQLGGKFSTLKVIRNDRGFAVAEITTSTSSITLTSLQLFNLIDICKDIEATMKG